MSNPDHDLRAAAKHISEADELIAEGDWEAALQGYQAALERLEDARSDSVRVHCYLRSSTCCSRLGRLDMAEDQLHEGLALLRQTVDEPAGLAAALGQLAKLMIHRGRPTEAAATLREAIEAAEGAKLPIQEAQLCGQLGHLEIARGDTGAARPLFERAMRLSTEQGDAAGQAAAAMAFGQLSRLEGDADAARDCFQDALVGFSQLQDGVGMSMAMASLGNMARADGDLAAARTYFQSALNMSSAAHDLPSTARAHTDLGNVAASAGEGAAAVDHYEKALALYRRMGDVPGATAVTANLAGQLVAAGQLEKARDAYKSVLAAYRSNVRGARAVVDLIGLIAQLDARLGRIDAAEEGFVDALKQAEALGYAAAQARLGVNLAAIAYARGEIEAGVVGFLAGAQRFASLSNPADQATALLVAADALIAQARFAEARRVTEEALHVVSADARERLDGDVMLARIAFLETPGDPEREEALVACADALDDAGRPADAIGARLLLVDHGGEPAVALAGGCVRAAEALGIEPLVLEARSAMLALVERPEPDQVVAVRQIVERADELGLRLFAVRARRRASVVLARAADPDADAMRQRALASARQYGAMLEVERLS